VPSRPNSETEYWVQCLFLLIGRRDQIGFVSQYDAIVILGLFLLLSLFQAHPRSSAILVDEFHAGAFQYTFDRREGLRVTKIPPHLNICDCISVQSSGFCKVTDGPIQGRTSHSYLCTCHRHWLVLLSHVQLTHVVDSTIQSRLPCLKYDQAYL
jgi:hypothetical protein